MNEEKKNPKRKKSKEIKCEIYFPVTFRASHRKIMIVVNKTINKININKKYTE